MTNEERKKRIEELGIKSDKIGLIPLDTGEIFKEIIHKYIDQAVAEVDEEENKNRLSELMRIHDPKVICNELLKSIISSSDNRDVKDFFAEVLSEIDRSTNEDMYGDCVVKYIEEYVLERLKPFVEKYEPYYEIYKDEYEKFQELWDEVEFGDIESSDMCIDDVSWDFENDEYSREEWDDRDTMFASCVDDLAMFCYPEDINNRIWGIEPVEADDKIGDDACPKIDNYLAENFSKLITYNQTDFEMLIDLIVDTPTWKTSSDYFKRNGMNEILKYAENYNLDMSKKQNNYCDLPEALLSSDELDELENLGFIDTKVKKR